MNYPATFELPTTDTNTGLVTSAYFRYLLREQLLPNAQTNNESLSLFLTDMDGLLEINNKYGRDCGTAAIKAVARILQETMPETTVISRYGGDEFGAILPDIRLDDAFTLAEEFRRRVAAERLEEWPEVRIACSIGLATYPSNGSTEAELIREADQACYTAKATGRNKVSLPLPDSRMITKTSHYTATQLLRLSQLAQLIKRNEAYLLREALDDLLKKYNDRLGALPKE